ncbi:hypothetical protein AVEN_200476-1 [Araneus ventricosus]|uniref:Uncharacterized protein n=1 Tax=Araneus ventricosus TaxID=182803 RepID=A0A4Y2ICU2_ARAVE|nr:hypothetical protein AVEN_200476-1 [Araneus ventricosus]
MTTRIVLLVDAIILRKNNSHVGVDMVRKDRCVLVLIHRLLVAPGFIWAVRCSTVARLFARTHLRSLRSPLSSIARGAPHVPCR